MNGTILGGRYELIEIIGEGGMAKVYKARCRILDRIVAVKILKDEFSKDKGFVVRFKTEALSAARINHPNIVNVYDVGQENDIHYIVMEYVDGQTLKEIIRDEAPLPVDKAVDIAIMICDGIHHAHEKGIIHRDIKPHNILITEHGMVKVADFGIARAMSNATITYGNNIVGSVRYISPEQAKGDPIDRTTDIYSVGCVLYEMVTGKVPFEAESPITVALKHMHDEAASPRSINSKVPAALEGVIYKAIQKKPAQRFATAKDMRNALIGLNSDLLSDYKTIKRRNDSNMRVDPISGERDEENLQKKKKIRPLGIALIAVAVLGLLAGIFSVMGGNIFGKEVAVPDIVGMDYKMADEELNKIGLELNVTMEYNDEFDKDQIISQDPLKGRKVKEGRAIEVRVSKGSKLISVPNVTGIDIEDAIDRLNAKDLNMGDRNDEYSDEKPEGLVISQSPKVGASVKSGTNINLVVSKGKKPDQVSMPDLTGLTVEKARTVLHEKNLELGEEKYQESNEFVKDQIAGQDKTAGEMIDEGTIINVVVSNGPGPQAKTRELQFRLADNPEYPRVVIRVNDVNGSREVYNELHRAGDIVNVGISYYGSGTAEVFVDGVSKKTYNLQ